MCCYAGAMTPRARIAAAVAFSVVAALVLIFLVSLIPGMEISPAWWLASAVIPLLISGPVAIVLVRQSESIRRLNSELGIAYERMKHVAETDPLTGVWSRNAFDARVSALRGSEPGWFLIVDVDHFKAINDLHGHQFGDRALRRVVNALMAASRPIDVVGRIGGEEIAVFLPAVDEAEAMARAERLRRAVEGLQIAGQDGVPIRITASIGVADGRGGKVADALHRGDRAMYRAKQEGRNRVQLSA